MIVHAFVRGLLKGQMRQWYLKGQVIGKGNGGVHIQRKYQVICIMSNHPITSAQGTASTLFRYLHKQWQYSDIGRVFVTHHLK